MALDPVTTSFRIFQVVRQGIRNRRERRMGQVTMNLPDGSQVVRTEPLIKLRTSTKVAAGAGVAAAYPVVQIVELVQGIEFSQPWLEDFTNGPLFVYLVGVIASFVVARFSRSPAAPQAL